MIPNPRPSPYLLAADATRYLHYDSLKALYEAVRAGTIPNWCVCRRGRILLFDTRSLDEWRHGAGDERPRLRVVVNRSRHSMEPSR